jgi:thiol-disulfide isomerase/thioredoxin
MESSLQENNISSSCDFRLIFAIIILIIFIFIFTRGNMVENMAPGVVTQMYAQDAQDTYLKGNVDQLATGNFLLNWNQPTRLATGSYYYTTGPNRGALLKNLCYKCKKESCDCKDGPVYYPMGYPGDHFEFPTPDINYPLPYIVSNGGFVREGFNNVSAKLRLFYADWCGHCRKFKPIFDGDLKKLINDSNIPVELEAIDCDKYPEEASKNDISGFPTLILQINDKSIKYQDQRSAEKIMQFIKNHINKDFVRENSNDNMAKLKLFYADWCGHCRKFKPIFDGDLKKLINYSNIPVELEAIDCDKYPEEASKNDISGFPTLILKVNDKTYNYEDEHSAEKIMLFIKEKLNM